MNLTTPTRFTAAPAGLRSGLPPRYAIPQALSERDRWLYGSPRWSHSCFLADDLSDGVNATDAPSTDPLVFVIRIPPYCRWVEWRVLYAGEGSVEASVQGSARSHKVECGKTDGSRVFKNAKWAGSTQRTASGNGTPTHLDVDNSTGGWVTAKVQIWITAATTIELWSVELEPLRASGIGTDAISTA